MPPHRASLVSELTPFALRQHGLFTRAQARQVGASESSIDRRVTVGEWVAVDHGVYRYSITPTTWHQRVLAACLAGPAVASHRTAAALHGIPGFSETTVEVTARRHRRRKARDVVWHESRHLDPLDLTDLGGIPTTCAARTLVDLGGVLSERGLITAYDDLVRRRLVTTPQVVETLERLGPRRRGAARVRAVLDRRHERSGGPPESELETEFDELVARFGLPRPVRQHEVWDGGAFVARLDFAYVAERVDLEVDGSQWHSSLDDRARDARRDRLLAQLGWIVLRFTAWDIRFRAEWVAIEIRRALRDRAGHVDALVVDASSGEASDDPHGATAWDASGVDVSAAR